MNKNPVAEKENSPYKVWERVEALIKHLKGESDEHIAASLERGADSNAIPNVIRRLAVNELNQGRAAVQFIQRRYPAERFKANQPWTINADKFAEMWAESRKLDRENALKPKEYVWLQGRTLAACKYQWKKRHPEGFGVGGKNFDPFLWAS
jgi:hypothetical protein